MITGSTPDDVSERQAQLFLALAEELKLPLMHIARLAELSGLQAAAGAAAGNGSSRLAEAPLRDIQATADMSLQLLDSYLLSLRLSLQPNPSLSVEPVSLSAVLHDTMQELKTVAGQYGVTLELHVHGRYEPVMAHRQALRSALVCLGYSLIEALPSSGARNQRLQLATHRTKYGIVAGVYGELDELTPRAFERAQELRGISRQPIVAAMASSGAGIFVADAILSAMSSRLRVGRFQRLPGFAVTLPASEQLQLI